MLRNWSARKIEYGRFLSVFLVIQFGIIVISFFTLTFVIQEQKNFMSEILLVLKYLLSGIFSGIIIATILLIRDYKNKQWDLHVVVPKFLIRFLWIIIFEMTISLFIGTDPIGTPFFNFGIVFGGTFGIAAYEAEVRKEHLEKSE